MKKFLIPLLFLFILSACAKRLPPPPRREFSGIINIYYGYRDASELNQLRANFRVNGFRNELVIVFGDMAGIPRGEAYVRNRRIDYSGMEPDREIIRFLEYWPLVFNPAGGNETGKREIDDIIIKYDRWIETEKGNFPQEVEILSPEFVIRLEIIYGI